MTTQDDFFSRIRVLDSPSSNEEEVSVQDDFFNQVRPIDAISSASQARSQQANQPTGQPVNQRSFLQEGGRQLARGARGLISGAAGVGGNLQGVSKAAADYVYDKIAKLTNLPSSSSINEIKKDQNLIDLSLPTSSNIRQTIDQFTNNYLTPETPRERIADTALEVIGSGGLTNPRNLTRLPGFLGEVGAGLGLGLAEESDLGALGNLGASIIGGATGRGIGRAISNPGELLQSLNLIGPSNIRNNVVDAAQRQGIDIPISAASSGRVTNFLENRLSSSAFTGKVYDDLTSRINDQYVQSYNRILNRNVNQNFVNNLEAGTTGQTILRNRANAAQLYASSLYENALENLPRGANEVTPSNLISKVNTTLQRLKQTAKPSSTERTTINFLEDLQSNLKRSNNRLPIRTLLGTKRSLIDAIDFEEVGGSKQLLKGVLQSARQDIAREGKRYPEFYKRYIAAERNFADTAKIYRNDLVRSLVNGENPEIIMAAFNNVDGIRKVGQALSTNATGKQIFNDLKAHKLQQVIGERIFDAEGNVRFGPASKFLGKRETNAVIKELIGPTNFKDLQDLQTVAQGIQQGSRKFANPSGTANTIFDKGIGLRLIYKTTEAISQGNPFALAQVVGESATPFVMAKLLTNQRFIKSAISAGRAGRSGNRAVFYEQLSRLGPLIYSTLAEAANEETQDERAK